MEALTKELMYAGIAIDLLVPATPDDVGQVGIRLRTYGKQLPPKKMVLAQGATFDEALNEAATKAQNRRWEHLDWAARPWPTARIAVASIAETWGFV